MRIRRIGTSWSWAHLALAVLTLFLILWLWILSAFLVSGYGPNGDSLGVDFSHTYSAILALHHGDNPYNFHVLSRFQHSVLRPLHLPVQPDSNTVLVGTSPFFFWVLQPLSWLPFQLAAILWIVGTYVLSGIGFLAVLRYFGWTQRLLPLAFFLAAPPTVLAAYYGNTISVVFFGIACSLPLLRRHPVLAGMFLSLSILKLPQAVPIAGLIILFEAPHKKRVIAGFLGAFVARTLTAYVAVGGWTITAYWNGLFSFSRHIGSQPNLVGFSGAYMLHVSAHVRTGLELLSIAIAGGVTLWWAWRTHGIERASVLDSSWLWCLWLLATPYAHFDDEMLLIIPVVALLGRNARNVAHPVSIAVLYLGFGSICLFSATVDGVQLLWVPLLAATFCFMGVVPLARKQPAVARLERRLAELARAS